MKKRLIVILSVIMVLVITIIGIVILNSTDKETWEEFNARKIAETEGKQEEIKISNEEALRLYNERVTLEKKLKEENKEILDQIKTSIETNSNCVSANYKGYEKIDEVLNILRQTNEKSFNLTKYFDFIINPEEFKKEVRKSKPEATDEDVERIYNTVLNYYPNYEEEETIYINPDGDKCIKVCDIRRLSNNDGIVKYFNGEYSIYEYDIPKVYNDVLNSMNKNDLYSGVYAIGVYPQEDGETFDSSFHTEIGHIEILFNYKNKEILKYNIVLDNI